MNSQKEIEVQRTAHAIRELCALSDVEFAAVLIAVSERSCRLSHEDFGERRAVAIYQALPPERRGILQS